MGQFYDEEKIKAMENESNAAAPADQPSAPDAKPPTGHFYDEAKIKAMGGTTGPAASGSKNLVNYALVGLMVVVGVIMLWWKITHNPDTMIVDINKASVTELSYLPDVGPVIAQRIVDARKEKPFQTIDDLKKIKGIGEKTFEKMKSRVKVE